MVTFVSLFLWLTIGQHPVVVAVEGPVATVEVLLDGRRVGVATPPEWTVGCDFGLTLVPHELVAVAYDAAGVEVSRARQVVNLPRPEAEVNLILEGPADGPPQSARVVAQNVERLVPEHLLVTFDGQPLTAEGERYALPKYDPGTAHILSAEALFPSGTSARDDLTIGGPYGGRVATELTAVAVEVRGRRRPQPADFENVLETRDGTASVAAVERPGVRVFLVRDRRSWERMRMIGTTMAQRWPLERYIRLERGGDLTPDLHRYHLVVPNPVEKDNLALFPVAGPFHLRRYSLSWLASHVFNSRATVEGQELAAAVAVAGVRAARESCPRAVILVLSDDVSPSGRHRPEHVRDYLRSLNVPLFVWTTGEREETPWGEARPVGAAKLLGETSEEVMKSLLNQWIVWIEGRHLPNHVRLEGASDRFRLAGE